MMNDAGLRRRRAFVRVCKVTKMLNQMAFIEKLAEHRVTWTLRKNGFTDNDLLMTGFRKTRGFPFALWSFDFPQQWFEDRNAVRYCHWYAILKWLATDPPPSPDREAAYHRVALFEIEPELVIAHDHGEAQSRRARRSRGKLTKDGETLGSVVGTLARHHPDESPSEIWPHFQSKLDKLGLNPKEGTSAKEDVQLHYDAPDGKRKHKTLTLRRFGKLLKEARKKMAR